jgi:hypothetical protein
MVATVTVSMPDDVYADLIERMQENGDDPAERGAKVKYIVDAIRIKNGLVKAGKWVPAEGIDFRNCKISK